MMDNMSHLTFVVADESDLGVDNFPEEFCFGFGKNLEPGLPGQLSKQLISFLSDGHYSSRVVVLTEIVVTDIYTLVRSKGLHRFHSLPQVDIGNSVC